MRLKKITTVLMAAAMCISGLTAVPADANAAASSSAASNTTRISVHDPSVFYDSSTGSYHHITVMGKENEPCDHKYDVTGSLCENNDKFAIDRMLPKIDMGDILVIHDTGAHGFSMGYNYHGKLRSAELLLKEDGSVEMIRRAETPKDYFATFDFCDLFKDVQ